MAIFNSFLYVYQAGYLVDTWWNMMNLSPRWWLDDDYTMALSQRVSPSPCIRGELISSVTNIFSGNWREDLQYTNLSDIKPIYNHRIPNLYSITHIFSDFPADLSNQPLPFLNFGPSPLSLDAWLIHDRSLADVWWLLGGAGASW